jgi:hypothetical protein
MLHKHRRIRPSLLLALLLAEACSGEATSTPATVEERMAIIAASDPQSPRYDTDGESFAAFGEATVKLQALGSEASPAAPLLARALAFPRRDSYMAARPLVALGPHAANALPILIENLTSGRPEVRALSAYVLGSVGAPASCAVPRLAPLLWDPDPFARTSVAAALEAITGEDLVELNVQLRSDPELAGSVLADEPEGVLSEVARNWWLQAGAAREWGAEYSACDP